MNLTVIQQSIYNAINDTEFTATRALGKALKLSCVCVRDNARILIDMGLVIQEEKRHDRAPFRIKKDNANKVTSKKEKPNFDRLLFSSKW